jgi:hypothetical protein
MDEKSFDQISKILPKLQELNIFIPIVAITTNGNGVYSII